MATKLMKFISIFLGFLIFVGLMAAIYGIAFYDKDAAKLEKEQEKIVKAENVNLGVFNVEDIKLKEPKGSSIKSFKANGAMLFLSVSGGGEADRIIIVDLVNGNIKSRISIGN